MKIVLSEEEYMKRLSLILKRDFFPSLIDLEEIELTDPERLSIDKFQSLYVTEDNASFAELLCRENERKRGKFERVFGGPARLVDDPSKRLLLQESVSVKDVMKSNTLSTFSDSKALSTFSDSKGNNEPRINLRNTRFNEEEEGFKVKIPDTPMFTFGTVAETPQRINNESNNLNLNTSRFRVPPTPVREQLAHSLITNSSSNFNSLNGSTRRSSVKPATAIKLKYELSELKALTPQRDIRGRDTSTSSLNTLVKKHEK